MKKRVFLIHGWEGNPANNWFPWLKDKLEEKGFEVKALFMPDPKNPVKSVWVDFLNKAIPDPDENTFLVGHSMGCQAIQRYLENLPEGKMIGGAVLVAGWINDPKWEGRTDEELKVVEDWYEQPKDYKKIRSRCKKFAAIYSADDPFVLESNWKEAEQELGASTTVLNDMSHFDDEKGIKELPEALNAVLEMSQ